MRQKVAGADFSPIGMRTYMYWPHGVWNAVFCADPSLTEISI